ncbi:M1 family aminopeptidase [Flavobacterium sp. RHBU_3]|uniref:M1 family aminopeptidase n=1 Tax=Flavobacterium sp. RHBU_3 TaxID=3391184 RepID=UPI003984762C
MRKITLLALLSVSAVSFAQHNPSIDDSPEFKQLVESEMKSAYKSSNFVANANTGNYDVGHQTLEFTVDPNEYYITGKITTDFTAKQSMSTITFDLDDALTVTSVKQGTTSLSFTQNSNNELVITLPAVMAQGQQATVEVNYNGEPDANTDAIVTSYHSGSPILWTVSEPYGAKDWWPCKQDLNDKINGIDVYITAPSQYTAVSNGVEISQTLSGSNKTTHFQHNYLIPAYLVAIAVTNYSVYTQTYNGTLGSFPVVNYLYPETQSTNQPMLAQTLNIMQFYEDTFEQFPFHTEKYGHAQWGVNGGMEHTTVSFMGSFGRELIAHEMGHQWFGDKITCGSWQDIWLNEGFATYLSGLVVEHQDGATSFTTWRQQKVNNITAYPNGAVYLTANDTLDENRIFSSRLSYNKGAMVLNMLRFKLGDTNFYQGIKNYLADANLAYGYAKTPDFQAHMETASGLNLDEFFNDWVYNQGYPTYTATVTPGGSGNVYVKLTQTQSHSSVTFFEMPVPVRLHGTSGQVYNTVLDNTYNNQQFNVVPGFTVQSIEVNPDYQIITGVNSGVLGTTTINGNFSANLYPNPAATELNLNIPDGISITKATFYNALGQKVLETSTDTKWNVAQLSAGVHFITLETSAGTARLKFVKQ